MSPVLGNATDKLTAAMAAGDAGAVDAFYRQYFGWMYAQARRVTKRDESFCLDVVQDAVLRVIRTVKAVDCESRFLGWLRLVVQTTAFDLLRREARRRNREAMAGGSQLSVGADSLMLNGQLDWLREQIMQLDPELVNIVELRFEQDWSLRRIGEKLGLSIGAVDGRLRRALKNLKLAAEAPEISVADSAVALSPVETAKSIEPEPAAESDPRLIETPAEAPEMPAIIEAIKLEPSVLVISEPVPELVAAHALQETREAARLFEPVAEAAEISVSIGAAELVGLEDEAGAYDDRI